MQGISVIICCFNSGDKLPPTLNRLAKQKILPGVGYELIIVDNNCTDNTIEIAKAAWASLKEPFVLTIVQESKAGLNFARETGIKTATYEYVILCDDDNWLCDDYLAKVFNLFEQKPEVALIGGVGQAVADIDLPVWFKELEGFGYAVGDEGRETGYVDSVYGAGMTMRKSVFLEITRKEFPFILTDRTGKNLSSGGDLEISMLIRNAGYKIYLDKSLIFQHFLNSKRLDWAYYLKLRKSFGEAVAYLDLYNISFSPTRILRERNQVRNFLSLVKYAIQHLKYLLFPSRYKNARCAAVIQHVSFRMTFLRDHKKMITIADQIVADLNEVKALQNARKTSLCE